MEFKKDIPDYNPKAKEMSSKTDIVKAL